MGVVPYLCLLLSCLAGVHSDIVLTQPESAVVKPGLSHRLSCAVSTFDRNVYGIHWVKSISRKGLVWLAAIYYDDTKYYAPEVQGRFTVSKDSSTAYLQMTSLKLDDTATYYCARYSNDMKYYLDYWGGGTSLTVTSEVKSTPSVYIIPSCNTESDQGIRLLCLVKDYQPESISQTWSTNSGDITTGIKKYPAVLGKNSKYTMSSFLEVSVVDWKNKVYYCKAGYKPNEIVTAEWRKLQPQPPKLSSLVPSREVIHSQTNAVLGCVISGFSPENIQVSWKKAGSAQEGIVLPSSRRSGGGFETFTYLTVPVQEWKKQKYTCEVNHAPSGFIGQVNITYQEDECSDTHPSVTLSKPSFEEIWTKRSATILCEVVHSDLQGFSVTWQVDRRKKEDGVRTLGPDSNGSEDTITSRLTVPAAEWNSGAEFSCVIEDASLPALVKKSIRKDTGGDVTRPHIYLLPPSSDEVDTDQTVTLMCLVTKFSPAEIYVAWMANDTLLKTGFVNQPVTKDPRKGWNTMTSQLKVSPEEWKSGTTFSCVVGHESLTTNLFRSINKSHSKPTLVNVSLVLTDSFKSCV